MELANSLTKNITKLELSDIIKNVQRTALDTHAALKFNFVKIL